MENSIEENNSQQAVSPQPQEQKEKSKLFGINQSGTLIVAIAIIVILLILGGIGYYQFYGKNNTKTLSPGNVVSNQNTPTQPASSNYQTFSLADTNLNDSQAALYFSDATKVYKAQLDGSQPKEVASLPYNISNIALLTNGDLLVNTDNSKYEKNTNKQPGEADYKQVLAQYGYWLVKSAAGKPEEIDEQKYQVLSKLRDSTSGEKIYTKELPDGQADIMLDKLDETQPTKIGHLKEKILKVAVCEVGDNCSQMKYPGEFYPSFNGSYLLNRPPGGGGLREPGIVVSRDGSKVYKIDFYWYVSAAIWLDDNRLLTKGQEGKQKIVTFKEDGTFSETPLQQDLGGFFTQNTLSPSGKLLFVTDGAKQVSLYGTNQNKVIPVETLNEAQVRQQLNLLPEEIIEERYYFIGWNKNSDKVLYAETTGAISSAHNNDRTIEQKIKIFDVKTGKVSVVAKLNPLIKNPEEYLLNGKPKPDITHFAIR